METKFRVPHANRNSLVDFHTGEKGFTLSKRGELAVLDELARAMPQGGLELAEPACWGAAASNAVVARGRGAAARLRWLALARRAVAASWCFLSFEEFVQSHADAVEGRRRAFVGSSEEDVWRVVRSALRDRGKTCLGREEFVKDVWPAMWEAFGGRWRSQQ